MDKNDIDTVKSIALANQLLDEFGLNDALKSLHELESEGLITEYECYCVSEMLRDLNERNNVRKTSSSKQ